MANFNVRVSDELAERFDAWAGSHGGRSPALRHLMSQASDAPMAPSERVGRQALRPVKLTVRLSEIDARGLADAACETGLTPNAWAAAALRYRLTGRPTFPTSQALGLLAIQAELRRIGVNVNQIARALNTAVLEGKVLNLEIGYLEALRAEIRVHMFTLREAFAGNLSYWEGAA